MKVTMIPIVVGSLGMVLKEIDLWSEKEPMPSKSKNKYDQQEYWDESSRPETLVIQNFVKKLTSSKILRKGRSEHLIIEKCVDALGQI